MTRKKRSVMDRAYPNATETQAELAWRYGEAGLPHDKTFGQRWFADGSVMLTTGVETKRDVRYLLDLIDGAVGADPQVRPAAPDWSAA